MGLDADTVIWLGVGEKELDEVISGLLDEMCDELEDRGQIQIAGLTFRKFYHAEETVGFGVELLNHSWRDGDVNFDLASLFKKVQDLMPKAVKVFEAMNIKVEPKVWLGTHL